MKFRKKPVTIEARQVKDDVIYDIADWCRGRVVILVDRSGKNTRTIEIQTLEGTMVANLDDWIIQGVKGEFYPCKHDIFAATYDQL